MLFFICAHRPGVGYEFGGVRHPWPKVTGPHVHPGPISAVIYGEERKCAKLAFHSSNC
jgi:hypothetical protein